MTTFRQFATNILTSNGLNDNQASVVMDTVIADDTMTIMLSHWDDDVASWQPSTQDVIGAAVRVHALTYLVMECPQSHVIAVFEKAIADAAVAASQ